jgi:hypothetical protein
MNGLMSDGGPAFPGPSPSTGNGLTVREYIAAQVVGAVAMTAAWNHAFNGLPLDLTRAGVVARATVDLTDALMAALRNS